ncbi:unnamed protein product, partial [Musa hybrid cultivar]
TSLPIGLYRILAPSLTALWIATPSQSLPSFVFHQHPPGSLRRPPSKLNKGHHATPSSPPCAGGILYYRLSSTSSYRSRADATSQLLPIQR